MRNFESDDPQWDLLEGITSCYLEEIEVDFFGGWEKSGSPLARREKVDNLLCQCYDRSHQNGVKTFHVSLRPRYGRENLAEWWMERASAAWPNFCTKGFVKVVPGSRF